MVPVYYYIALSAILFTIGVVGVLTRRNAIIVFMSIELMLNAADLVFVAFARLYENLNGQIFVLRDDRSCGRGGRRSGPDRGDLPPTP